MSMSAAQHQALVVNIAQAYNVLGPRTQASLAAYLAGDHSPAAAHDLALRIVATTTSDELALILARLLVMVEDEVVPAAQAPVAAAPAAPLAANGQEC